MKKKKIHMSLKDRAEKCNKLNYFLGVLAPANSTCTCPKKKTQTQLNKMRKLARGGEKQNQETKKQSSWKGKSINCMSG